MWSYSAILEDMLGRWRECFKHFLNLVTLAPSYTHEVHGEILQLSSPSLSKYWRLRVAMKSDLKCPKPWIDEFFRSHLVSNCLVFWKGTVRLAHLVIIPTHKEPHRKVCTYYWGISFLALTTGASLSKSEFLMLWKKMPQNFDNRICAGRDTNNRIFTLQ